MALRCRELGPLLTLSLLLAGCGSDGSAPTPAEPAGIQIVPTSASLQQRQSAQLTARVLDAQGAEVTGQSFAFTSEDTSLALVSSAGLVTSVGPAGSTVVRVTSGGLSATMAVDIAQTPTVLQARTPVAILAGTSRQLTTTVLDAIGVPIPDAQVVYSSSAPEVSIAPEGLVTALGPTGIFAVRAAIGVLQDEIQVVVPTHPAGVVAATEPLSPSPWGVAISSRGLAYITQPATGAPALKRVALPTGAITAGATGTFGGLPLAVAFSSDGLFAYVPALSPGSLSIVDTLNQVVGSVGGLSGNLYGVLVSQDDSRVYVTGDDDLMYVIDAATRSVVTTVDLHAVSNQLILHPTLPRILASSFNGAKVLEIDAGSHAVLRTLGIGGQPQGLAVAPDGSELYVADELGRLVVWDLSGNTLIQEIPVPAGAFGLALTPDAAQIYVTIAGGPNGVVLVYDRTSRTLVRTIPTGGSPRRIAFDMSGQTAIITNDGSAVHVIK
jgi:DNA-binding beta-propeller fold protein YncE